VVDVDLASAQKFCIARATGLPSFKVAFLLKTRLLIPPESLTRVIPAVIVRFLSQTPNEE